jgi:predicted ferric reductase
MTTEFAAPQAAPVRPRHRPRRAASWWRDGITVACWTRATIVGVLWLGGGGWTDLAGGAGASLTSVGRLTGLVAADLLLMQVLLMARVPAIERSYGQDELARRHRLVGFGSFTLLLAHIALIITGYALSDRTDVVHETWSMLTTYPGMLLAAAGTAALILVTGTSIRVARRKLRYESWHLLHLYAYLGVGLTVPHQIWTGADFASSSAARIYWWSSYVLAAGAVLLYRVGLPFWRSARHRLVVAEVTAEGADVVSVRMTGRALDRLPAQAGQFFVFRFLDGPGWTRGKPYSLSAVPDAGGIRITVKDLGAGSARLAALAPGTRVLIEGPYGRLTGEHRAARKVVLMANGIGITPLRALLEDLDYAPGEATLLYRARTEADLVLRAELDEVARRRGATVIYLPGPRVPGRESWLPAQAAAWPDPQALRHLVPAIAESDLYVCGPERWMDAVKAAAFAAGLLAEHFHEERFTW